MKTFFYVYPQTPSACRAAAHKFLLSPYAFNVYCEFLCIALVRFVSRHMSAYIFSILCFLLKS